MPYTVCACGSVREVSCGALIKKCSGCGDDSKDVLPRSLWIDTKLDAELQAISQSVRIQTIDMNNKEKATHKAIDALQSELEPDWSEFDMRDAWEKDIQKVIDALQNDLKDLRKHNRALAMYGLGLVALIGLLVWKLL